MGMLRSNCLRNSEINLTDSLSQVIKEFQNVPITEQARERLKPIKNNPHQPSRLELLSRIDDQHRIELIYSTCQLGLPLTA